MTARATVLASTLSVGLGCQRAATAVEAPSPPVQAAATSRSPVQAAPATARPPVSGAASRPEANEPQTWQIEVVLRDLVTKKPIPDASITIDEGQSGGGRNPRGEAPFPPDPRTFHALTNPMGIASFSMPPPRTNYQMERIHVPGYFEAPTRAHEKLDQKYHLTDGTDFMAGVTVDHPRITVLLVRAEDLRIKGEEDAKAASKGNDELRAWLKTNTLDITRVQRDGPIEWRVDYLSPEANHSRTGLAVLVDALDGQTWITWHWN